MKSANQSLRPQTLRAARRALGLSTRQMGEEIGAHFKTIEDIERRAALGNAPTARRYLQALEGAGVVFGSESVTIPTPPT